MSKQRGICKKCGKEKEIHTKDGWCNYCYRKYRWEQKKIICKRCKKERFHHGKGMCPGCYNSTFHIENVKDWNARRYHNIEPELYRKVREKCVVCDFNKVVELHHIDHNKNNNSEDNFVGLCPNHHKMIHMKLHQAEIFNILKEKGFKIPESNYSDGFFKK